MKRSTYVKLTSLTGAIVLASIGILLIILNWMGADGQLANQAVNVWTLFEAYGFLIGPTFIMFALLRFCRGIRRWTSLKRYEVAKDKAIAEARADAKAKSKADAESFAEVSSIVRFWETGEGFGKE